MISIKDINCPYCGARHLRELYHIVPCTYSNLIWDNGKLVYAPEKNPILTHFKCCDCGQKFIVESVNLISMDKDNIVMVDEGNNE